MNERCTTCGGSGSIDKKAEDEAAKGDHDRDIQVDNLEPHDGPTDFNQS